MKKKITSLIFILALLFLSLQITTADEESDKINTAYSCLNDQLDNRTLSLQQAIFATLAIGSNSKSNAAIEGEKNKDNCWPKSSCNIKETSQVILALDRSGKSTKESVNWLLSKNKSSNDLNWFLQIDIPEKEQSSCTLSYNGLERQVTLLQDMKIGDNLAGECFSISSSGYWLQVKDSCLDYEFEISCDKDFVTSLIYQKSGGSVFFVSKEAHSSASLGTTSEKVNAKCFKVSGSCDYEGTLWAALALSELEVDVSSYIPYIIALAEDNSKYFPSAFLYILTKGTETESDPYYSDIIQRQKSSSYWDLISPYKRHYDTSLAMLALTGSSASSELENTKDYLLSIQGKNGCWSVRDSIIDTSFLLYSGWPKSISSGTSSSTYSCAVSGKYCEPREECLSVGGEVFSSFTCPGISEVCCSENIKEKSCSEKQGTLCSDSEECNGEVSESSDGSCCLGSCEDIPIQIDGSCNEIGGTCKSECSDGEQEDNFETCSGFNEVCCIAIDKPKGSYGWIILLIILIAIVILGIIYRRKIQIWWHDFRNKKSSKTNKPSPPPGASAPNARSSFSLNPNYRMQSRPPQFHQVRGNVRPKQPSNKDREMEETLRKLRDMSK